MWEYTLVCTADVPAWDLYAVLADLPGWADWNDTVRVSPHGEVVAHWPGAGNAAPLVLEEQQPPRSLTVAGLLPLTRLLIRYDLDPVGAGSMLVVTLRLEGVLSTFWRRAVAAAASQGLANHAHRLMERARQHAQTEPGPRNAVDHSNRPAFYAPAAEPAT